MSAPPGQRIVIVGAGHAGVQAAVSLRQEGHAGPVILIDGEDALPYQRPPLSKAYLKGDMPVEALAFRRASFFEQNAIERLTATATAIDRAARRLLLEGGIALPYDHLILAPGARNRVLPVPGWEGPGVVGMRTLQDADLLRRRLPEARRVAVIGAGFIGLEFAAVAAAAGARVDVVELGELPMGRALTSATARHFLAHHARAGIRFHLGRGVARILRGADGQPAGLVLSDGSELAANLVVYGIGVLPNVELAQSAGLACDNGIVVDRELCTEDPHISAIGDAVSWPLADERRLRLESVQNAVDQARQLGLRLARGVRAPYHALPWFWSDQGALRLQIAGLAAGHDATHTIGEPEADRFSVLCFAGGCLVCVESVNRPADHMAARRILAGRTPLPIEEALRPDFSLKGWEASRGAPQAGAAAVS